VCLHAERVHGNAVIEELVEELEGRRPFVRRDREVVVRLVAEVVQDQGRFRVGRMRGPKRLGDVRRPEALVPGDGP
jgi:hypothetical protein